MRLYFLICFVLLSWCALPAQVTAQPADSIQYPHPVHYLSLTVEAKPVRMAYMDVKPAKPNGQTALLLHGKNFNGYYWKDVISWLSNRGYRVIVPDQIGWGKSSHPNLHYSFHQLATNTIHLLDTLGIKQTFVLAHSMGGMLATRLTLMYPERVIKLVLENPIGLEDYKTFVPYQTIEQQYQKELKATYASYKQYQHSYYPVWKPEYEALVKVQASDLQKPDFKDIAWTNAVTYQMIYEQPVSYEFSRVTVPTLLIIGQADRTIVGKALLSKEQQSRYGQYPALGRQTAREIKSSKLVELPGVGHIPHIQVPDQYFKALGSFLP
ncbi:alpha/beta fold hydrolase [Spirosoma soli]|uniref:Alpha/beta fold hydrolase n=1 Tax=Spirosoma soli TaxID=1770529 RepID=A0ABW5M8L6_9BACT